MVTHTTDRRIGVGLYTPFEAALYARIAPQTIARWLYGSKVHENVIDPQLGLGAGRTVTFFDLIQAMAVRRARTYQIPLSKIRQAVERAQREYDVEFPLARKHRLLHFDGELFIELPNLDLRQLSGYPQGQAVIREIAEPFMSDLQFGPDGLADEYIAWRGVDFNIKMNPRFGFGQPLVGESGYPARVLVDAYEAEGSVEAAASAFGVQRSHVMLAVEYFDHLGQVAA